MIWLRIFKIRQINVIVFLLNCVMYQYPYQNKNKKSYLKINHDTIIKTNVF